MRKQYCISSLEEKLVILDLLRDDIYFLCGNFLQVILTIHNFHLTAKSLKKMTTPMHFRPLRIWPITASSTHHFPLGFILQQTTLSHNTTLLCYSAWEVFSYPNLLPDQVFIFFLQNPVQMLSPPTSSPWPSQQKEIIIYLLCALNLFLLIHRFHHMNDLFISCPLPWALGSQAGFILVLCVF